MKALKGVKVILFLFIISVFISVSAFAQVSTVEKTEREVEKEKELRQKIETERKKPQIEEQLPAEQAPPAREGEKILIKRINVTGATLVSLVELDRIIGQFENRELSVKDMQRAADTITDLYRRKGYVTSRAYIPPQKIEAGVLEIRVVEGTTGDFQVKGNKYFKTP